MAAALRRLSRGRKVAPNTTLSPSQRRIPLEAGDEMQQLTIADDVEHRHDLPHP